MRAGSDLQESYLDNASSEHVFLHLVFLVVCEPGKYASSNGYAIAVIRIRQ